MSYANFKVDLDGDGIALVTWDVPGRSMNLISLEAIQQLAALVEQLAGDAAVKGVVITSGKDTFCAGADLTLLESLGRSFQKLPGDGEEQAATRLFEESRKLSLLYRRIETCGKPWVAAINGTAVGGGFELALACHHRVASQNPQTRLGLPEIKVGLFPGAGGTTRIARMLAPADALQFLLKGDQIKVERARAMKLIDAIVPPADLVTAAKDWIKAGGKAKNPWDLDGFKLPGGAVYSKTGMMTFPAANAIYRRETYDNYPAARAILQVVYEGLQLPFDLALRVESRWFAKILRSPQAAAMMRSLFVSMQELNKGARRPDLPRSTPKRVGIIGAGFMGASVGYVTALAGIDVVLIDRDQETAERGKAHSAKLIGDQINRGRATAGGARRAHRTHHRDRRLRRARRLRPRHRSRVRGPQGEGRDLCEGASVAQARRDLRLQHLDPADHLARQRLCRSLALHRHPFLLAGRADDAGRDHPRQGDRRRRARHRARLRARDPQDARSWSTIRAASTPRASSALICARAT